jgi:hypothetical protein
LGERPLRYGEPSRVDTILEAELAGVPARGPHGRGTSRKADLHDLRTALLHKRLVYETTSGFRMKQP